VSPKLPRSSIEISNYSNNYLLRDLDICGATVEKECHNVLAIAFVRCSCDNYLFVGTEKRGEKVVVLRELQRAIIYTRELSKQTMEGQVSRAFTVYSVS
jgi:hypothetical protein